MLWIGVPWTTENMKMIRTLLENISPVSCECQLCQWVTREGEDTACRYDICGSASITPQLRSGWMYIDTSHYSNCSSKSDGRRFYLLAATHGTSRTPTTSCFTEYIDYRMCELWTTYSSIITKLRLYQFSCRLLECLLHVEDNVATIIKGKRVQTEMSRIQH